MTLTMKDIADKYVSRKQEALNREVRSPRIQRRANARREVERLKDLRELDITMESEVDRVMKEWGSA